jgi:hypothetical protein
MKQVLPLEAQVRAHSLPVLDDVAAYKEKLTAIQTGSSDDCVEILAGSAASLKEGRVRIQKIAQCLNEEGLRTIQRARLASGEMRLQLEARATELANKAKELCELIQSERFYETMSKIRTLTEEITSGYRQLYEKAHADRSRQYQEAVEKIKGRPEWGRVPESMRETLLRPLTSRACEDLHLLDTSLVCQTCRASLDQMESDVEALGGLFAKAVAEMQRLTTPQGGKVERVRVSEFFAGSFETPEQVKEAVARLQDHLLKLLDKGVKIVVE